MHVLSKEQAKLEAVGTGTYWFVQSRSLSPSLVVPALTRSFKVRLAIGECWLPLEQRLASRVEGCDP
jgi:hypothetical protein